LAAESQLVWKPELRLEESTDALVAKFRLPEVQSPDVQVYIDPQRIVILAEAKPGEPVEGIQVHGDEFRYGQIYREVCLPVPIDPAKAKARLGDGVLTVSLPKPKLEAERKPAKAPARRKKATPKKSEKEA
jgi:HSP20 family protein